MSSSDQEVAYQILHVFHRCDVSAGGFLMRNKFASVRDGDFQRAILAATANGWISPATRDRYKYFLTEKGRQAMTDLGATVA